MRLQKALEIEKEDFKKRLKIRKAKGADYADDWDCLINFKAIAEVCRVFAKYGTPVDVTSSKGVAVFYQLLKLQRRLNLYAKKTKPENESIMDTFLDASNYLDLEKECFLDESTESSN